MTAEAARFTGSIPEHYDHCLGPNIFVDFAVDMAQRVAALAPSRILETAAGTGILTRRLRDALPAGTSLTATDLNPPMLEVAKAKFQGADAVEFMPADAMALPFADAAFDAVVCQFGVMFFPDKGRSYGEVHRLLAPGGHYLFSVWDAFRYNPFAGIANGVVERFFPDDPPQFYKVPVSCHEIDPVKNALIAAGFSDISISVVSRQKEVVDPAAFARGLVFGNPLVEQIRMRGGVDPEEVVATILRELQREFGAGPTRMPLQIIVFSARRP